MARRKYTINDVRKYVEQVGYTLISNEFKRTKDKIKLKCPNGHDYYVSFGSFN